MTVTIALVYPELLGTYGDGGNATVLAQRLAWRGHEARVVTVHAGQAVPETCELYVVGGGEDLPQALAAEKLRAGRALHHAVDGGAVVLAVCAGLQILGERFVGPDGRPSDGLGILDCRTTPSARGRAIGEILVQPAGEWAGDGLPVLSGFENHSGVTELGPGCRPAGSVVVGVGNQDGTVEGAVAGRVWGTYLHGPVLARNPRLADMLLGWAVGPLGPLDDQEPEALHAERCRRARGERGRLWRSERGRPSEQGRRSERGRLWRSERGRPNERGRRSGPAGDGRLGQNDEPSGPGPLGRARLGTRWLCRLASGRYLASGRSRPGATGR